jgi:uncharacterized protein (TIGR02145 family)
MDRNLGALQVATSITDTNAYGDKYQWGRFADGHQCINSGTIGTLSSTDNPGHANFILTNISPADWRIPQNTSLWQGPYGLNNPCPMGYRIPTNAEFTAERLSWSSNNGVGAFASPQKWTSTGMRQGNTGSLAVVGSNGHYWSSDISGTGSLLMHIQASSASTSLGVRSFGRTVRCIMD